MGPKEVGLLYVRKERIAAVWPNIVSVGWNQDSLTASTAARKFEVLGQRDDAAVAAVGTAVDFYRVIGYENVEARVTQLATALREGLARINKVKLVTPAGPNLSGGVVVLQVSGFERQQMGALTQELYTKYGVAGAATGGLRLCPHVYNTMADVELAIRGVRELLA